MLRYFSQPAHTNSLILYKFNTIGKEKDEVHASCYATQQEALVFSPDLVTEAIVFYQAKKRRWEKVLP